MAVKASIAKEGEPERFVAEMKRVFGPIDILVNNAGM
jgi:NAD(P)-dependent dehydrogenase (short-subunit alcohol dehydrogenase family)